MKTLKFVFLLLAASLLLLTSCLENTGNSQTYQADNAVVRYFSLYPEMTFLDTPYGSVAAPELDAKNYNEGDCLFASFTIDYDNQPAPSKYTLVSNMSEEKIRSGNIIMLDSESQDISSVIDSMSVDSIRYVAPAGYFPCIDNKLFMGFDQLDSKIQNYEYQLVFSVVNDIPVLYVCAKSSPTSSATPFGNYKYQAFDITPFFNQYADDKNRVTFHLRYKKGVDENGKNVYESSSNPITIYNLIYKESN